MLYKLVQVARGVHLSLGSGGLVGIRDVVEDIVIIHEILHCDLVELRAVSIAATAVVRENLDGCPIDGDGLSRVHEIGCEEGGISEIGGCAGS